MTVLSIQPPFHTLSGMSRDGKLQSRKWRQTTMSGTYCWASELLDRSPERIAELREGIRVNEGHLADCQNKRPTEYLRQIMQSWAGTDVINFDYVAGIIEYGLEEDYDNLHKLTR